MSKSGIHINVPGHGELFLRHVITDYTGTLSYRGVLSESVHEKLRQLGKSWIFMSSRRTPLARQGNSFVICRCAGYSDGGDNDVQERVQYMQRNVSRKSP